MKLSDMLSATLAMFSGLTVQGPQNAKLLSEIFSNLELIRNGMKDIENILDNAVKKVKEKEANDDANRDEQE